MQNKMPPRSRLPRIVQTVLFFGWPHRFVTHCQRRLGDVFTLSLFAPGQQGLSSIVYLADPAAIKELFSHDGKASHAGSANAVLDPITGPHSILLLDREDHLRERRLIGAAFHGQALKRLETIIHEATTREIASWPADSTFAVRPAMQRITFEVIMRAVLGVHDKKLQAQLLEVFEPIFNISAAQIAGLVPAFRLDLGPLTPWGRFRRKLAQLDGALLGVIAHRRREGGGDDILSMLLATTDEDGVPLTDRHIRDELVTLLLAGHETTATSLAWAFERLARNPSVREEVRSELASGSEGVLDAVAAETLRVRPVVMDVARQLSSELEIGGYRLPPGTTVMPSIYLVHFDAKNHDEPEAFRPGRFRDYPPSKATWMPFGGGRRRCVGAAFAQMEMRTVLSIVLAEFLPEPASRRVEHARLRGVTFVPEHDAVLRMRRVAPGQPAP